MGPVIRSRIIRSSIFLDRPPSGGGPPGGGPGDAPAGSERAQAPATIAAMAPLDPRLSGLLARAPEIVFVCSGNVVRSAFAHLYAVHLGLPRRVRSLATRYRNPVLFAE